MNLPALILGLSLFGTGAGCMIAAPLFSRTGSYVAVRLFALGLLLSGLGSMSSGAMAIERDQAVRDERTSMASVLEKFGTGTESEKQLAETLRSFQRPDPFSPLQLGMALVAILVGVVGLVRPRWLMLPSQRRLYDDNQISSGMEPTA